MDIKIDLLKLKKTQNDLRAEMYRMGFFCTSSQLSLAVNDDHMPKSEAIRQKAREIISVWKSETEMSDNAEQSQSEPEDRQG